MIQNYLVIGIILKNGSSHEHITHLVYYNPVTKKGNAVTVEDVIKSIKPTNPTAYYFTHISNVTANVTIGNRNGKDYVKTNPDGSINDNLLRLPTYSL